MATDLEDYSLARVIKGIHDSTYTTIAVDDSGNIIGVFKGEYGTTLHTIKVDSEGRMLAIITDPEDVYGNIHMVGNAELAARLGSINKFDRRGDTVWMDDFEGAVLLWDTDIDTENGEIFLTTESAKYGSQSCKLITGGGLEDSAKIEKYMGAQIAGKIGLEVSFASAGPYPRLIFELKWYTGVYYYIGGIYYSKEAARLYYLNHEGTYAELPERPVLKTGTHTYHTVKFVIDTGTGKYVRCLLNNEDIDLSSHSLQKVTDGEEMSVYFSIQNATVHYDPKPMWVDNVIVTQNES